MRDYGHSAKRHNGVQRHRRIAKVVARGSPWLGLPMLQSSRNRYTRTVDIAHFKRVLLRKERDLLSEIQRLQNEAREPRESEVQDEMDEVISSEVRAAAFEESSLEWQTLQQVRDALQRIEDGAFGKCIDCGRDIQPARLRAVPWTPYCVEDQQKHDAVE